jgi:nitrous oxidase accessory protein NosD
MLASMIVIPASAATLMVGPGQEYSAPSQAAAAAKPGDIVRIAPGTYYDCAIWTANNLTIEGTAPGVVLTDTICGGKAIFVVQAEDVTVSGLTFARARAPDGNGAGIRAEGNNLTVVNSKFVNNQEGILAGDNPKSTITVQGSDFEHNGACSGSCAHGIYVGRIALLRIEHSRFFDTQIAHHIKSCAARTEISGNTIKDGPEGTASYLIDVPKGGSLLVTDNVLEKGPKNQNHTAAISIGEEGVIQSTDQMLIAHNTFTNDGPPTSFVHNVTATPARLQGNSLRGPGVTPLTGDGSVH